MQLGFHIDAKACQKIGEVCFESVHCSEAWVLQKIGHCLMCFEIDLRPTLGAQIRHPLCFLVHVNWGSFHQFTALVVKPKPRASCFADWRIQIVLTQQMLPWHGSKLWIPEGTRRQMPKEGSGSRLRNTSCANYPVTITLTPRALKVQRTQLASATRKHRLVAPCWPWQSSPIRMFRQRSMHCVVPPKTSRKTQITTRVLVIRILVFAGPFSSIKTLDKHKRVPRRQPKKSACIAGVACACNVPSSRISLLPGPSVSSTQSLVA